MKNALATKYLQDIINKRIASLELAVSEEKEIKERLHLISLEIDNINKVIHDLNCSLDYLKL